MKGLGTNKTGSNIALKHACKHAVRPPQVKNELHLNSNDLGLICGGVSNLGGYKRNA